MSPTASATTCRSSTWQRGRTSGPSRLDAHRTRCSSMVSRRFTARAAALAGSLLLLSPAVIAQQAPAQAPAVAPAGRAPAAPPAAAPITTITIGYAELSLD